MSSVHVAHSRVCVCVGGLWVRLAVDVLLVDPHYYIEIHSPASFRFIFL